MVTEKRIRLSDLMNKSWRLVKVYGFDIAEAMQQMWAIFKLEEAMQKGIVKFFYQKLDGTTRTAWGTLKPDLLPEPMGMDAKKKNDSVMVYYDQEKASFRCFKIANFIKMVG